MISSPDDKDMSIFYKVEIPEYWVSLFIQTQVASYLN
jgi:hypothetical protein